MDRHASPPNTPLTQEFNEASSTIEDLTASLTSIHRRVSTGTPSLRGHGEDSWEEEKKELEGELMLCAEIGQALLRRHESYVGKAEKEVGGLRANAQEASDLLNEANTKLASIQSSNENLVSRLATSTRENSQLERRLLQSLTSLTLSDSSIATLRAELSSVRGALSRQAGAQARSTGWEDKIKASEREKEELKDELVAEKRKRVEAERKASRALERVNDLENKLKTARSAVEQANKSKEDAAREIVEDAKTRMEAMHNDLSTQGPPNPEVQLVLDALTTENVTLRHDNDELRELLAESRELQYRSPSPNPSYQLDRSYSHNFSDAEHDPISRSSTAFFSDELAASTSSRRLDLHSRKDSWAPSIGAGGGNNSSGGPSTMDRGMGNRHGRNDSWTPSLTASVASTSSYGGNGSVGMLSPRLDEEDGFGTTRRGVYPVGNGSSSGRRSRGSIVPSTSSSSTGWTRGHGKRSFSVDRPSAVQRAFSGVDSIAEWGPTDDDEETTTVDLPDEPLSPTDSFLADRKITSFTQMRRSSAPPNESGNGGPHGDIDLAQSIRPGDSDQFVPSGLSKTSPEKQKQVRKRPMMLLSRSKATQTDVSDMGTSTDGLEGASPPPSTQGAGTVKDGSRGGGSAFSPAPSIGPSSISDMASPSGRNHPGYFPADGPPSETSSIHDPRTTALSTLIDHMARLLARAVQSDVPTLSKRLKRQHLPHLAGDVGHLSRSTITSILVEVNDLRAHFRSIMEAEKKADQQQPSSISEKDKIESQVTKKDFLSLIALFKTIFTELSNLRGTINEVILDPSAAVKLRDAALNEDEDDDGRGRTRAKPARQPSGLGWIAAPISKFFVTPPVDTSEDESTLGSGKASPRKLGGDRGKLHPSRTAPKLAAATGSTATTVNVEFASSGAIRRAVSTAVISPTIQLPPSPNGTISESSRQDSSRGTPSASSLLAPPSSLGPSSRSASQTRSSLQGIFAGARSAAPVAGGGGGSWVMVGGSGAPPGRNAVPRLRSASSQIFRPSPSASTLSSSPSPRHPDGINPKRLSTVLDAMLDPSVNAPINDRPLRPTRSDESIRSTFTSSGPSPSGRLLSTGRGIAPSVATSGSAQASWGDIIKPRVASGQGAMFAGLKSRIAAFTSDTSASLAAPSPTIQTSTTTNSNPSPSSSPPRAIPPNRSRSSLGVGSGSGATPPSLASAPSRTGLFGGLASWAGTSLVEAASPLAAGLAKEEGEEEEQPPSPDLPDRRTGAAGMDVYGR
ncbi:hypothetical protein BDY24DRAFT_412977 [Mrakia frigida]|uniref:uncharacterized protein n=1 Tax=Mrakia frigida TaxID=29902 RepID=UPI003FCC1C49